MVHKRPYLQVVELTGLTGSRILMHVGIEFSLRPAILSGPSEYSDVDFIFSSWMRSYEEYRYPDEISSTHYFSLQQHTIELLLSKSTITIAHEKGRVHNILGYLCANTDTSPHVLHYVYVKHKNRRDGLARALVDEWYTAHSNDKVFYTHRTKLWEVCCPRLFGTAEYNPYLIYLPWPPDLRL